MNQVEEYYVVKRTKTRDEKMGTIEAPSIQQAASALQSWCHENQRRIKDAEEIYIFSMQHLLKFDANNRLVKPKGEVRTIINIRVN